MYGAILGDIIGSPYEFDRGDKSKEFELFDPRVHFTDDSAMTLAIAKAILSAESVAAAIFLLRNGSSMEDVKEFICSEFGYDLSRTLDEIRPGYYHVESCQQTVPEAITAFLESTDFEDAIRNAVSLGGDCDTLTCITGSLAEAYYGVPADMVAECERRLPEELLTVLKRFEEIRR